MSTKSYNDIAVLPEATDKADIRIVATDINNITRMLYSSSTQQPFDDKLDQNYDLFHSETKVPVIAASAETDGWIWRRWGDGVFEAWRTVTFASVKNYSVIQMPPLDGIGIHVDFQTPPLVTCEYAGPTPNIYVSTAIGWPDSDDLTKATPSFRLTVYPSSTVAADLTFKFHVYGYCKPYGA